MTVFHGFELRHDRHIPAMNSLVRHYIHQRTGAELLTLSNDDENKVFGVTLRTPPADSTGIAHILEHSVLCGSKKYPVKAPFLELLKGSLKTFVNAFTYPDKTCYPVASQNLQDFYNLVDVYLDAVFHPRLTPETLQQEGWHYELSEAGAPLAFKGVVFNEMKGAYSSPDAIVGRHSARSLFPNTPYGVDSGGDPARIPDLTYAAFKAFHERYYHPSNARFFFYGDDNEDWRLARIDALLADFERTDPQSGIALQPRFEAPRKSTRGFAASTQEEGKPQARITVNWMLDEMPDRQTALVAQILGRILVGNSAAPLRKALIDSGFGEGLTGSGVSASTRQITFTTGLKGIDAANADKVEALILDTLSHLASDGIDPATVEAAINSTEFASRELNTGSFPRGIALMIGALSDWLYERDPVEVLDWEGRMQALKARVAAGERVFEDAIRRWFLDNPHRTTVLFTPDSELAEREAADERARLDAAQAGMSEAELAAVLEDTAKLKRLQATPDSPEALASIPALKLTDLAKRGATIPIAADEICGTRVFTHDLSTNGIVYLDLGFDLRTIEADLLPYVHLFSRALLETGTRGQDFVALTQRVGRSTGGISRMVWTSALASGGEDRGTASRLFLRAKAVPEKAGEMLAILRDVLQEAQLDNVERIGQMIREAKVSMEAELIPSGHAYAGQRVRAGLCEADWVSEQMHGIANLQFVRGLAERPDGTEKAITAFKRLRDTLVTRPAMVCNVTSDAGNLERFAPELASFLGDLPARPAQPVTWSRTEFPVNEGLTIPAKVNYVAKGENLHALGFHPGGEERVARQLANTMWLWEKVRVQGGAYGGGCGYNRWSGILSFYSYRDPNLLQTLENFDGTATFLRNLDVSETELVRAQIGVIGAIDAYMLPDAKGLVSLQQHLAGDSAEDRQMRREEVLGATLAGVRAVADAYAAVAEKGRVAVLGSEEAIETANAQRGGNWLTISKVM